MRENTPFTEFPKMPRLSRECVITEKIDGTNASIYIAQGYREEQSIASWRDEDGKDWHMMAGSRTRWITPQDDNYGFARWATERASELKALGKGHHFGEWWGSGIQRGYGLTKGEKRFSLFNTVRWCDHGREPQQIATADPRVIRVQEALPPCCHLVPTFWRGSFSTEVCQVMIEELRQLGSRAELGFMRPEGIVVYHIAAGIGFKKTLEKDEVPKSKI